MDLRVSAKTCPICAHFTTYTPIDEEYHRCPNCGMIRTKYNYDASQYGAGYAKNYLDYTNSPCNQSLNLFRLGLVSRWLLKGSSILDIGCCVGEFIRFAEPYYACSGFEPNEIAARTASMRVKSPVASYLNGLGPSFDCITMFDVIEHIEEPSDLLKHCIAMLFSNGIIAITTPDVSVVPERDTLLRSWKHWKPKEHLYLYTSDSLKVLFGNLGFEIVHLGREESRIRPGNTDGDLLTCVARRR